MVSTKNSADTQSSELPKFETPNSRRTEQSWFLSDPVYLGEFPCSDILPYAVLTGKAYSDYAFSLTSATQSLSVGRPCSRQNILMNNTGYIFAQTPAVK